MIGNILVKTLGKYAPTVQKIAKYTPPVKGMTLSLKQVETLAKLKGGVDKSIFEAAKGLLGNDATVTLAVKASKLHKNGSKIVGAVIKNGKGDVVAKGATLFDLSKASPKITTKFRSAFLNANYKVNPNELTKAALQQSKTTITSQAGKFAKGNIEVNTGSLIEKLNGFFKKVSGIDALKSGTKIDRLALSGKTVEADKVVNTLRDEWSNFMLGKNGAKDIIKDKPLPSTESLNSALYKAKHWFATKVLGEPVDAENTIETKAIKKFSEEIIKNQKW